MCQDNLITLQHSVFMLKDFFLHDILFSSNSPTHVNIQNEKIVLYANTEVNFDSFFNSFPSYYYKKYTCVSKVALQINFVGKLKLKLKFIPIFGKERTLIEEDVASEHHITHTTPFVTLPEIEGRISLSLRARSPSTINFFSFVTNSGKKTPVTLALITCTYKKEDVLEKNLRRLFAYAPLRKKKICFFVIDNGRTLLPNKLPIDDRLSIVPNRNLGGTGGFMRGLIEVLSKNEFSHALFMDDDVIIEPEIIFRVISFFELCRKDIAISGAMLKKEEPTVIWEMGARYLKDGIVTLLPLKKDINLLRKGSLEYLYIDETIDYGAWWFFAFPLQKAKNLIPPIFLNQDDCFFSLLLKKNKVKIIALPGIGVWHEAFEYKIRAWLQYYITRNALILKSVFNEYEMSTIRFIFRAFKSLLKNILNFEYAHGFYHLKGIDDFLKGPNFLISLNAETYHNQLLQYEKNFEKNGTLIQDNNSRISFNKEMVKQKESYKASSFLKRKLHNLVFIFSLGGYLLPRVFKCHSPLIREAIDYNFWPLLRYNAVISVIPNGQALIRQRSGKQALQLLLKFLVIMLKSFLTFKQVKKRYKNIVSQIDIKFWKIYLQRYSLTK